MKKKMMILSIIQPKNFLFDFEKHSEHLRFHLVTRAVLLVTRIVLLQLNCWSQINLECINRPLARDIRGQGNNFFSDGT